MENGAESMACRQERHASKKYEFSKPKVPNSCQFSSVKISYSYVKALENARHWHEMTFSHDADNLFVSLSLFNRTVAQIVLKWKWKLIKRIDLFQLDVIMQVIDINLIRPQRLMKKKRLIWSPPTKMSSFNFKIIIERIFVCCFSNICEQVLPFSFQSKEISIDHDFIVFSTLTKNKTLIIHWFTIS